jgi:hypothetical protein
LYSQQAKLSNNEIQSIQVIKMKKIFFVLTTLCFASFAFAQTTPESYLQTMPAPPQNVCNLKAADKKSYLTAVHDIIDKMDKDIRQRKKASQAYVDANRDKIAANMMTRAGQPGMLPPKSGKMTKEERKAMAAQMMQQYGVTPEDTKKLKKMSKEEKTAWALAHSADAATKAQADPQQHQDTRQQAKLIYNLQMEQKEIHERIEAGRAGFTNRLRLLAQSSEAVKSKEVDPLQRKASSLSGAVISKAQEAIIDQVNSQLRDAQKRYCETFAPQYLAIVDEYLAYVKTSLPDYLRLEEIMAKTQLGLDHPIDANNGLFGIQALRDYASLLTDVFKYNLLSEAQ